jgi:uncharacterized protein (TIGR00369 family)
MEAIDLEVLAERLRTNVSFARHIGLVIDDIQPGRAVCHLDVSEVHMNGARLVHGGVHASLMDSAMGVALMALGVGGATLQTDVHYLEPVTGGRLQCVAEVIHRAGRTATLEARVRDEAGKLVAQATGSFRIFRTADTDSSQGSEPGSSQLQSENLR